MSVFLYLCYKVLKLKPNFVLSLSYDKISNFRLIQTSLRTSFKIKHYPIFLFCFWLSLSSPFSSYNFLFVSINKATHFRLSFTQEEEDCYVCLSLFKRRAARTERRGWRHWRRRSVADGWEGVRITHTYKVEGGSMNKRGSRASFVFHSRQDERHRRALLSISSSFFCVSRRTC